MGSGAVVQVGGLRALLANEKSSGWCVSACTQEDQCSHTSTIQRLWNLFQERQSTSTRFTQHTVHPYSGEISRQHFDHDTYLFIPFNCKICFLPFSWDLNSVSGCQLAWRYYCHASCYRGSWYASWNCGTAITASYVNICIPPYVWIPFAAMYSISHLYCPLSVDGFRIQ